MHNKLVSLQNGPVYELTRYEKLVLEAFKRECPGPYDLQDLIEILTQITHYKTRDEIYTTACKGKNNLKSILPRFIDHLWYNDIIDRFDPVDRESEYLLRNKELIAVAQYFVAQQLDKQKNKNDLDLYMHLSDLKANLKHGKKREELESRICLTKDILLRLELQKKVVGIKMVNGVEVHALIQYHKAKVKEDEHMLGLYAEFAKKQEFLSRPMEFRNLIVGNELYDPRITIDGMVLQTSKKNLTKTTVLNNSVLDLQKALVHKYPNVTIRAITLYYKDVAGDLLKVLDKLDSVFADVDPQPKVIIVYSEQTFELTKAKAHKGLRPEFVQGK